MNTKSGSSLASAAFVQTHNAIGTGLLLFPYTFWAFGGILETVAAQLALVIFVGPSLLIMAYCAEIKQVTCYQDVISHMCGRFFGITCQVCMTVGGFGACVAMLILIGDQLVDMASAFRVKDGDLSERWYFDRRFSISVLSTVIILPLLMLKNIGSLSYTSVIGFLSSLYIAGVVVVKYFIVNDKYLTCNVSTTRDCQTSWTLAALSVSFMCSAYMCHVAAVSLYSELKKRSVRRYIVVIVTVMSSCLIVYSITGAFGYLTFNGRLCISGDVLRNYCPRDIPISIARVMIVVSLITLYPIVCYNSRLAFDSIIKEIHSSTGCRFISVESRHILRARVESVVWFLLTLLLAIFIPDILKVMGPLGGLASVYMLTFPGLCLLNLLLNDLMQISSRVLRLFLYIVAGTYIVIGCYIFGSSVTYSVMSELQHIT